MRHCVVTGKLKECADDNFRLEENDGKFYTRVENTEGKGEITRYEQFLFFPQCFQKTVTADLLKQKLVLERAKLCQVSLYFVYLFAWS